MQRRTKQALCQVGRALVVDCEKTNWLSLLVAVVCLDREVAEEVAKVMPERRHHIEMFYCLHHEATGIAFRIHSNALLSAERLEILTRSIFDAQIGVYKEPFYWHTI